MMRSLGKSFDTRHVDRLLDRCRRVDLCVRVSVVFGGPGENRDSVRTTARYANERLAADELVPNVGYRVLPQTPLAGQLALSEDDLLSPTFYPFDPQIFSWIIEDLDARFLTPHIMLNLMAARTASRKMATIPLSSSMSHAPEFPYLALTRRYSSDA